MTKRQLFVSFVLMLALPVIVWAAVPVWMTQYDGSLGGGSHWNESGGVATDNQGNVFITGRSSNGSSSVALSTVKYLPNGDTAWTRSFLGNFDFIPFGMTGTEVLTDGSGNAYVRATGTLSGNSNDFVAIKYLPNGDTAWVRTYNDPDNGYDVTIGMAIDASENVYVNGFSLRPGMGFEFATIKYLPNGDTAWMRFYQIPDTLQGFVDAMTIDAAGNVYLVGHAGLESTSDGFTNVIVIKYDPLGNVSQMWTHYEPRLVYPQGIRVDYAGNVFVAGEAYNAVTEYDYMTMKFGVSGDFLWEQTHDCGGRMDVVRTLAVDVSGNVYVTGISDSSPTGADIFTIKYNSDGATAWIKKFGFLALSDVARDLTIDDAANVYVTGASDNQLLTVKYDSDGNLLWVKRHPAQSGGNSTGVGIALDQENSVIITGIAGDHRYYAKFCNGQVHAERVMWGCRW